jgi:hypothetical protein
VRLPSSESLSRGITELAAAHWKPAGLHQPKVSANRRTLSSVFLLGTHALDCSWPYRAKCRMTSATCICSFPRPATPTSPTPQAAGGEPEGFHKGLIFSPQRSAYCLPRLQGNRSWGNGQAKGGKRSKNTPTTNGCLAHLILTETGPGRVPSSKSTGRKQGGRTASVHSVGTDWS